MDLLENYYFTCDCIACQEDHPYLDELPQPLRSRDVKTVLATLPEAYVRKSVAQIYRWLLDNSVKSIRSDEILHAVEMNFYLFSILLKSVPFKLQFKEMLLHEYVVK